MGVFLAWFVAAGFQTYRDVTQLHRPPLPAEFVASGAVFAALGLIGSGSPAAARLAGVTSWGILLAIILAAGGPQKLATNGAPGALAKYTSPGVKKQPGPQRPPAAKRPA